jgi:putative FmdB family regulatory protein
MPLYEYECRRCGVRFERRQSFTDEPVRVCPECGGAVYRLVQPVGIVFKGSGFYVTDHRSTSSTATPGKKTEREGAKDRSDASSDGKSE